MNNKEYIESGVLELYVAGALPEQEMIEVTQAVKAHPELLAEVERIESAFMAYASLHAPKLPDSLLQSIYNHIQAAQGTPPRVSSGFNAGWLGWIVAALGLLGCLYLVNQSGQCEQQQQDLVEQNAAMAQSLDSLQQRYSQARQQFAEVLQSNTTQVVMGAAGQVPDAEAIVYWNRDTENVYVLATNLPEPPAGYVYQLWWMESLEPLTPNDAGLLEGFADNPDKFFQVKPTSEALAFAITLEPEGGSKVPTLEQLYVFGAVG